MQQKFLRVLILEDDKDDARFLATSLKKAASSHGPYGRVDSIDITIRDTLQGAIQEIETKTFDIILTDLHVHDSRGLQTVRGLLQVAKEVPIIVLSELSSDDLALEAVREGAQDYITKQDLGNVNVF